jgi:hypothetical protein
MKISIKVHTWREFEIPDEYQEQLLDDLNNMDLNSAVDKYLDSENKILKDIEIRDNIWLNSYDTPIPISENKGHPTQIIETGEHGKTIWDNKNGLNE